MQNKNNIKKIILISAAILLATKLAFSQGTAINKTGAAADNSAILDLNDTTKGILIPRMKKVNKLAISNPATGLMIYQTNDTSGFWYYNGVKWVQAIGPAGPSGPAGSSGYKRIFVSSATGNGDLSTWSGSGGVGGLTGGDNICQYLANNALLGGTWKAFLSTSTVDAYTRFSSITVPIQNMKGQLLYFNGYELYCPFGSDCSEIGSTSNLRPVYYDEYGNIVDSRAWTGTKLDGMKSSSPYYCSDWTSVSGNGVVGCTKVTGNYWKNCNNEACTTLYHIYCIEL